MMTILGWSGDAIKRADECALRPARGNRVTSSVLLVLNHALSAVTGVAHDDFVGINCCQML